MQVVLAPKEGFLHGVAWNGQAWGIGDYLPLQRNYYMTGAIEHANETSIGYQVLEIWGIIWS